VKVPTGTAESGTDCPSVGAAPANSATHTVTATIVSSAIPTN
jgi:hypothetical protein